MIEKVTDHIWAKYRQMVPRGTDPDPDDELANDIRNDIIVSYMYLADMVVRGRKKSLPKHVDPDDLRSLALEGLLQAVQRYNETLGVPFEAFVIQRMRSVVEDGLRREDWAPRSLRTSLRLITQAEDRIRKEGREPTQEDVADLLQTTVDDISLTKYKSAIATHTYIEANLEAQNKAASVDEEEEELIALLRSVLARAVENLPIRQAAVIALHYYEGVKIAEIAKILKTTEQKIGMYHTEAILQIWQLFQDAIKNVASA